MLKKTIYLIFIAASLFAQTSLKIMTYNLQGMKPGTAPEIRIIHIIDKLIQINPDIIGFQEINESLNGGGLDNQARVIADSLSAYFGIQYNYYIAHTHLSWDNQYREYIGIVTKHPVENEGYFSLVPGVFPRKVVWNSIITPLGKINFFNTHLSFNSATVRLQQAQQIATYIQTTDSNFPALASILTGDFNDIPSAASIQSFTNTGTDTFFIDTFADFNPGNSGYTFPSNNPTSKIDYIFYKNIGNLSIDSSYIVMNQPYGSGNFCSDHFGVLTFFGEGVSDVNDNLINHHDEFKLFQNYPNPFNPNTNIEYRIQNSGVVSLKVYDMLGNEVATVINEEKPAGIHEVDFNAVSSIRNPASGIYFYQLKNENYTQTKKMILLK